MTQIPNRKNLLINAGLFYLLWFAAVVGSGQNMTWPALLTCLLIIVWQLHPSRRHPSDFKVLTVALILGLIADSLWINMGLISFTDARPFPALSPLWILALWAGFGLTINHCLYWLKHHPVLPVLSGTIGGPLSYYAGIRFGAVEYLEDVVTVSLYLAIGWTVSIMILVKVSRLTEAPASTG
ncbi:MAG: DUF2878 domain-containing protein [Gammaproteobacteria bacterium]|nr:DUF2878 domain-containing protein [Gammaproteobacteria bacterium]